MSSEPRKKTILPSAKRNQCCMYIAAVLPVALHGVRPVDGGDDVGVVRGEAEGVNSVIVDVRADLLEEPGHLVLAVVAAVPRHRRAGGLGRPVDVVGELGQDGVDVAAAVRRVQALDGFDLGVWNWLVVVVRRS